MYIHVDLHIYMNIYIYIYTYKYNYIHQHMLIYIYIFTALRLACMLGKSSAVTIVMYPGHFAASVMSIEANARPDVLPPVDTKAP